MTPAEVVRARVLQQFPLRPGAVLARVIAAGLQREAFPDWWDPHIGLGATLLCMSGFRMASRGRSLDKGSRYTVVSVRFPTLEHGQEREAALVVQDSLDSSFNVPLRVRFRDTYDLGRDVLYAKSAWDVAKGGTFKVLNPGPFYWPRA